MKNPNAEVRSQKESPKPEFRKQVWLRAGFEIPYPWMSAWNIPILNW
jgi:hypothetical protein